LEEVIKSLEAFGLNELWIFKIIGVSIATILIHFVVAYAFRKLIKTSEKTANYWDDVLVVSASKPLPVVVWLVGILIALQIAGKQTSNELFDIVPTLRSAVITVCFAWFFWRLINESSDRYLSQQRDAGNDVDYTTVDALSKLGRLVAFVVAALTLMQTFGLSISGLLAAGGIGGMAIGFAAKDTLGNLFAGIFIMADSPYKEGDYINLDTGERGFVRHIGIRSTRILTRDAVEITIPNSVIINVCIFFCSIPFSISFIFKFVPFIECAIAIKVHIRLSLIPYTIAGIYKWFTHIKTIIFIGISEYFTIIPFAILIGIIKYILQRYQPRPYFVSGSLF
jgi:MscS family membrane protein